MAILYKIFLCFAMTIWSVVELQGQVFDDWEARPTIAIEREFDNGIEARIRYRHSLDNNMSHYKESSIDLKVNYKFQISSWLEPSIDYRFKLNGKEGYHDIRYGAEFNQCLGQDLKLTYSPKLQQVIETGQRPDFYVRNEIEMTYQVSPPFSVSIFSENYQRVNRGLNFDAQKNGLGTEYAINKTNELELKMDIKNNSSQQDIARLTLSYTYIID